MAHRIFILNGPNLNLLGAREPEIYGRQTLAEVESACREAAGRLGLEIDFRQSNHEGTLVDWLQEAGREAAGVVLNPGAHGHTSIALRDAILGAGRPVIEVHISNVFAREPFRHRSYVTPVVAGVISGLGPKGYLLALEALADLVEA